MKTVAADLLVLIGAGVIGYAIYEVSPVAAHAFTGAAMVALALLLHPPAKR